MLAIADSNYIKKNENGFVYKYTQTGERTGVDLNPIPIETQTFSSTLHSIYFFNEPVCVESFQISKGRFTKITEKALEQLLSTCTVEKSYSRNELEDIVLAIPRQPFTLECAINDSFSVRCEPSTDRYNWPPE